MSDLAQDPRCFRRRPARPGAPGAGSTGAPRGRQRTGASRSIATMSSVGLIAALAARFPVVAATGRRRILPRDVAPLRGARSAALADHDGLRRDVSRSSSRTSRRRRRCPISPTSRASRWRAGLPITPRTPRPSPPTHSRRCRRDRLAEHARDAASLVVDRDLALSDLFDLAVNQSRAPVVPVSPWAAEAALIARPIHARRGDASCALGDAAFLRALAESANIRRRDRGRRRCCGEFRYRALPGHAHPGPHRRRIRQQSDADPGALGGC